MLLALSWREAGVVLLTDNGRNFDRIRRRVRFEFVEPSPSPSSPDQRAYYSADNAIAGSTRAARRAGT